MAITTTYAGIEYRSRLEARYAAFFNALGWKFTYEPFDGDGYIPDFVIHGEQPLLIEVKPAVTVVEFQAPIPKLIRGLRRHWKHDILIFGASPLPLFPLPLSSSSSDYHGYDSHPVAGLLGEIGTRVTDGVFDWAWEAGRWITCGNCISTAVFHSELTCISRPCGCYKGGRYVTPVGKYAIPDAWAMACNDVKWRGRAA